MTAMQKGRHRKLLEQKLAEHYFEFRHAEGTAQKRTALWRMTALLQDHRLEFDRWQELMQDEILSDSHLFSEVGGIVTALKNQKALQEMIGYLERHHRETQAEFACQVLAAFPDKGEALLVSVVHLPAVMEQIQDFIDN